ncbi:MAG: large conductance mechanosensitive channel protein MscL [Clostridiales bacterium]|nr:large conductance mechanosensitive channel protein MscL [Clostridiales bacterium]
MEKKPGPIRRFFGEFKKFITRGNVLDMAVGVIVGGAFTAIVTALSNNILRPLINYVLMLMMGEGGLEEAFTFLDKQYDETGAINLETSIYIDWGAFVSAIINFLLIAFVLFMIVRAINRVAKAKEEALEGINGDERKIIKQIRKEEKVSKDTAHAIYAQRLLEAKEAKEEAERLAAEKAAEEARIAEEKATANTRLLEEIRDLLKGKQA